jgi:hypothetical protein
MNFMAGQMAPEIDREAFVKPKFHAMPASSDSFASSRACTAISRDTPGN